VAGATFALFYAQYFALFTVFGGSTPGMMLRGLRVVSFGGGIPASRQMAWRSFGYLISAGTCFLGFVWALWDEDQLCWQDRISETYLTPIEEITPYQPRGVPVPRKRQVPIGSGPRFTAPQARLSCYHGCEFISVHEANNKNEPPR
jgi:hypothetical protein